MLKRNIKVAHFSEVVMQPYEKLTKEQERQAMRDLMEQRQQSTPKHHDPCWVYLFWRRVAS
jgi:hypothetical protein